jgi:DNA-binding transcriptional ArsR family regulator
MKKTSAVAALDSIANEGRLDIFRLLIQHGPAGMAAGDIGARLKMAAPTLSFHLNHLRNAGLVAARRAGRSIIYQADYRTMNGLVAYLTENCCGGNSEICAPSASCAPAQSIQSIDIKRRRIA